MAFEKMGLGGELQFDVEEAVGAMVMVSQRFREMSQEADNTKPPVDNLRGRLILASKEGLDALNKMKGGLNDLATAARNLTLAFLPVTYAMKKGFDVAVDFERQMSETAAVTGLSTEEMTKLGNAAKQMAIGTEDAPVEILQAMQVLKSAGADATQSMKAVKDVMDLADAAGMENAETARFVAQTIKSMGMSFDESQRAVDIMAKTTSRSGSSLQELGEAIRMSSGQATNMGISFEELNAMIGIMSQAGYKGSRGGMALVNMLKGLSDPTDKARKQMAAWGIALQDSSGKMLPMSDIVSQLSKKLAGVKDASKRAALAQEIFGSRGAQAFNMLAASGEDAMNKMVGDIMNSTGAAAKMAEQRLANTWGEFQKFWNNIKLFALEVFEPFLKPVADVLKSITGWLSSVVKELMAIKEVGLENFLAQAGESGTALTTVQEIAVGILQALDDLRSMWNSLVESVKSFGNTVGKVLGVESPKSAARMITKILAIGGALAPVAGALGAVAWVLKGTLLPAFKGIWKLASGFAALIFKSVIPALVAMAKAAWASMAATKLSMSGMMMGLGGGIKSLAILVGTKLLGAFRMLFTFIKVGAGPIFLIVGLIWSYLQSAGKEVNSFGDVVRGFWDMLKNTVGEFIKGFMSRMKAIWEGVKKVFNAIGKLFDTLFGWLWEDNDKTTGHMKSGWADFGAFLGDIIVALLEGFAKLFDALGEFIVEARSALEKFLANVDEGWQTVKHTVGSLSDEEFAKEKRRVNNIRRMINDDINKRQQMIKAEKARQEALRKAAAEGIETKTAGRKKSDLPNVNVDVNLDDKRKTEVKNTFCVDGKKVAVAVSRAQTEIMERSGARKEAYQKTASREFGVPVKKTAMALP